jgi:CheY-like chemotaxis protein
MGLLRRDQSVGPILHNAGSGIAHMCSKFIVARAAVPEPTGECDPMPEVLLAEDNPADVYLIREALREHDVICNLSVAHDGKEALRIIDGVSEDGVPLSLIILDLNLPRHDGIEILEHLLKGGRQRIPVIVLTSSDSPRDRQLATRLGADRYLRKPSELESFLSLGVIFKELLALHGPVSEES